MAPVNVYKIPLEPLLGTRKIMRSLICGTRGLKFLTRALRLKSDQESYVLLIIDLCLEAKTATGRNSQMQVVKNF